MKIINTKAQRRNSQIAASLGYCVNTIHDLDILLNDRHAPKRTVGSQVWKDAKLQERLAVVAVNKDDKMTVDYSTKQRKDVVMSIYHYYLSNKGFQHNPQFWHKIGDKEEVSGDMILGKLLMTDKLYKLVNTDQEIIRNVLSFRTIRAGGRTTKDRKKEPLEPFAKTAVSSMATRGMVPPSALSRDSHSRSLALPEAEGMNEEELEDTLHSQERSPSPRQSINREKPFGRRANLMKLNTDPVPAPPSPVPSGKRGVPRRSVTGIESDHYNSTSASSISRPPPKRPQPSRSAANNNDTLLPFALLHTLEKLSSYVKIQAALLQMPDICKEMNSLLQKWNPNASLSDTGRSAFEYAKELMIQEDGNLSEVQAVQRVMEEYPSAFDGTLGVSAPEHIDSTARMCEFEPESSMMELELIRNPHAREAMRNNDNRAFPDLIGTMNASILDDDASFGLNAQSSLTSVLSMQGVSLRDISRTKSNNLFKSDKNISIRDLLEKNDEGSFRHWLKNGFASNGADLDMEGALASISMCDLTFLDDPSFKNMLDIGAPSSSLPNLLQAQHHSLRSRLELTNNPSYREWSKKEDSEQISEIFRMFTSECSGRMSSSSLGSISEDKNNFGDIEVVPI